MLLNEELSKNLMMQPPDSFVAKPVVDDVMAHVDDAEDVDSLLLKEGPASDDIYFSFMKDVLDKNPDLNIRDDLSSLRHAEDKMVMTMFKEDLPYSSIIHAMTNSPFILYADSSKEETASLANDSSLRWTMAFFHVSSVINPMFCQDELMYAKPIHLINHNVNSDADIYASALHTILKRKPNLSLRDADKQVVKLLQHNNHDVSYIKKIMRNSPTFNTDLIELPDDAVERVNLMSHITGVFNDFIKDALSSDTVIPKRSVDISIPKNSSASANAEAEDTNDMILKKMNKELSQLRETQYSSDALHYWENTMKVIASSFAKLQIEKQKAVCEVIIQWSDIITSATHQMSIEENPSIKKIHDRAVDYKEKAKLEEQDWSNLFTMVDSVEKFTKKMLIDTADKIKSHPLMKNPSVYNALPYEELIQTPRHKPQELYYSLLRKAVLDKPNVGILEADIEVKNLLDTFKLNSKQKAFVLTFSPRYAKLPQKTKEAEVTRWLSTIALQEGKKHEGKVRS